MHHRWRVLWGDVMGNLTVKESGEMASFISPNVSNITSFKVHFSPRQEGSGDPSPENVREITGWNGVEGYGCGKNLFNMETAVEGYIDSTGKKISSPDQKNMTSDFIPVIEGETYIWTHYPTRTDINYWTGYAFYSNKDMDSVIGKRTVKNTSKSIYITVPADAKYIRIGSRYLNGGKAQLEKGSIENASYEPYQTTTTTTDWTEDVGTIYGGYVDLVSGELVQNFTKSTINDSTTMTYRGISNGYAYFNIKKGDYGMLNYGNLYLFSNYCTKTIESEWSVWIDAMAGNLRIYVPSTYNSLAKFKAYLAEHPLDISYKISEPITYQLTPQQLSTFKGQNNFWSNADYVEIEYELTETFDIQKAKRKIILSQPHIESASGDIVTFDTDMKGKLKECKVYFSPVQEGEGDPSPNNVRNIVGWNGVNIYRHGINFAITDAMYCGKLQPSEGIIKTANAYKAWCIPIPKGILRCSKIKKPEYGNIQMIAMVDDIPQINMPFYGVDGIEGSNTSFLNYSSRLVDNTTGHKYLAIFASQIFETFDEVINVTNFMITLSSIEIDATTNYIEPNADYKYSIDWTNDVGTVYGGYVDLVSGELVQTHYKLVADGINGKTVGSIYKDKNRDIFGFRIIRNYFSPIGMPGTGSTIICDSLPILYNKYQSQVPFIYSYSNGNRYVILYCGKLSEHPELVETEDYQAFVNAWLVEHPLTFVYKLETPIHYQLTPQQLTALRGTNTIYSNANGQIDIKYWTRFPKINYMKDVQWLDHSYITSAGKLTEESTALSHTTVNSILLPAGNYRIDGFCYQEPPANSLNCRVHEYSAGGSWIKLITSNTANTMSPYILEFSLDHDSYIKLSLPRLLNAKLIKI